jgi:hypothetical protein
MVATEQIKMRAKLAGAEIKESPYRGKRGEDPYGDMLARRKEMRALDVEFQKNPSGFKKYTKPL